MNKFGKFVVDKRFIILAVFIVMTIASVAMIFFVPINSDILSYLPSGLKMTDGLGKLKTTFGMEADAMIGVGDVTYEEMEAIIQKISDKYETTDTNDPKGIKPGGILWIGMIDEMQNMDNINMGFINIDMGEMGSQMLDNQSLLAVFYPNPDKDNNDLITFDKTVKAKYLFMLQLDVSSSSNEALNMLDDLDENILPENHAIGGSTEIVRQIFRSTIDEMYKYILVAVLVMFIVLLLTTDTLIDSIIFILTIGISIIVNLGTNIVFKDVSIVTFACSAVLQLALSMDYSIFLMHSFSEEKKRCLDEKEAMRRAVPKTFTTVTASALTTLGGFMALFVMRFGIGADLGRVLAKGVMLSLITVVLLQPCLMLMFSKVREKSAHKLMLPKFKSVAKLSISKRYIIVLIAVLMLIPAAVLQQLESNNLSYIKFVDTPEYEEGSVQQDVNTLSNSIIVLVPVDNNANQQFIAKLEEIKAEDSAKGSNSIAAYMSIYTMIPENYSYLLPFLENKTMMDAISKMEGAEMISGFVNDGYTMYEIMITCDAESPEAEALLNKITAATDECFGSSEKEIYITGMAQAVLDLKEITPTDFMLVTLISVLVILLVLIVSQKSIKMPILLVALIELGIFINLSLCYIAHEEINFMCYIILSSIQLGSTVDYAILYTDKYQRNLEYMSANEAAYKALRDSASSILTSVCIMAGCCLSVTIVASNTIVKQMTWLIARGSIISGILTVLVLPSLLVVFTGHKKLKRRGLQQSRIVKSIDRYNKSKAKKEINQANSES